MPSLVSIAVALVVAAFATSTRVPLSTVMNVGLVFEVASSYGISLAEYLEPTRLNFNGWMGLSWVAVWALLFTVVIPTRPVKATIVTFLSLTSVPVVIAFMVLTRRTTFQPDRRHLLLLDSAALPAHHHHGLRRRASGLHPRQGSHRSARAPEAIVWSSVSARAAWARCGRRASAAGASRGDQVIRASNIGDRSTTSSDGLSVKRK